MTLQQPNCRRVCYDRLLDGAVLATDSSVSTAPASLAHDDGDQRQRCRGVCRSWRRNDSRLAALGQGQGRQADRDPTAVTAQPTARTPRRDGPIGARRRLSRPTSEHTARPTRLQRARPRGVFSAIQLKSRADETPAAIELGSRPGLESRRVAVRTRRHSLALPQRRDRPSVTLPAWAPADRSQPTDDCTVWTPPTQTLYFSVANYTYGLRVSHLRR